MTAFAFWRLTILGSEAFTVWGFDDSEGILLSYADATCLCKLLTGVNLVLLCSLALRLSPLLDLTYRFTWK